MQKINKMFKFCFMREEYTERFIVVSKERIYKRIVQSAVIYGA